jgi:hypothetical protein
MPWICKDNMHVFGGWDPFRMIHLGGGSSNEDNVIWEVGAVMRRNEKM